MKKIVKIINEEITKLNLEGVADTYGEKFGLSNPAKEMDRIAKSGIKPEANSPNGELVGEFDDDNYEKHLVFLNPKSLNDFDENVRAITENSTGNLFIAQTDGNYYHADIATGVNDYENNVKYSITGTYDTNRNLTWHRIYDTNTFGVSISCWDYVKIDTPQVQEKVRIIIETLNNKHPQFKFIPRYWNYLRHEMNANNPDPVNNNSI